MAELLAKLSRNAAQEAEGRSQAERSKIANTSTQAFLMGADAIGHIHGLSTEERSVAMIAAHSLVPPSGLQPGSAQVAAQVQVGMVPVDYTNGPTDVEIIKDILRGASGAQDFIQRIKRTGS